MQIQHVFVTFAAALSLAGSATSAAVPRDSHPTTPSYIYPNIADTSHATHSLVDFCHAYFTAKTLRNLTEFASYFIPTTQDVYFDATVGLAVPQSSLAAALAVLLNASTPDAMSYPLRIIGDMNSAVVLSVDTPGLFGTEVRSISAVDFGEGKAARWIDYWDGRLNPLLGQRAPDGQFPTTFGESAIKTKPNPAIQTVTTTLHAALSTGNSTAAADLFSFDAVFEDRSTHTRIEGQSSIEEYLQRALPDAPYGIGATVRHVVGGLQGGAYEWIGAPVAGTPNGITALELDTTGKITGLYTLWDSSRTSNATLEALVGFSIVE
jgi:hypothetical protein